MRKKKNNIFALVLVLFLAGPLFAAEATVSSWDATVVRKPGSDKIVGTLVPGMVVNAGKKLSGYTKISFKNINGWVPSGSLTAIGEQFSNVKNVPVLSGKIVSENGKEFLFYYHNGRIVKYNVTERLQDSSQNVKEIEAIYPSTRSDLFLLEGTVRNGEETRNYRLFYYSSGKTLNVGSFPGYRVSLETFQFSANSDYLAAVYLVDGQYITCVYNTGSGELVAYARRAKRANWINNSLLVLNNNDRFWTMDMGGLSDPDISYRADRLLVWAPESWKVSGEVESRVIDGVFYVQTRKGVYELDIQTRKTKWTPYRSLLLNPAKTLNFYFSDDTKQLRDMRNNSVMKMFSGKSPQVDFIAFAQTNIIGRTKYEKIDTLFLYGPDGKEIYRYRSIDEPEAFGDSGVLADIALDKNLMLLTVEDPWKKQFYLILEKE